MTQWNISTISYNASGNTAFAGSYMEEWLNDTTVDGFLGNLRDPENFIKMDSVWNATETAETTKSASTTLVIDPVGLLNAYEFTMSYSGTTSRNSYLNNDLYWWLLTPYSSTSLRQIDSSGRLTTSNSTSTAGVRPSINLKPSIKIIGGTGTVDDPYRLKGDSDSNLSGTMLSNRYSGEYIRFGNDENNLYRIVSHENGSGTKIVSAEPLKNSGAFVTSVFDSNSSVYYSNSTTIGTFLNGDYLTNYVDSTYIDMIEDSTTWYLGQVGFFTSFSYKLAKYADETGNELTASTTIAKVGLLRHGELLTGPVKVGNYDTSYWILTSSAGNSVDYINFDGKMESLNPPGAYRVRPASNLKSNVIITGGDGTKENPFTLALQS